MVLLDPLGPRSQPLGRLLAHTDFAEPPGEAKLLLVGQVLVPEHQHDMPAPLIENVLNGLLGQLLAQIEAADFRAQGRRQGLNPHFSNPPWSARRRPADRAGKPRGAMRCIGQAA